MNDLATKILTWGQRISAVIVAISAIVLLLVSIARGNVIVVTCMAVLALFAVIALIVGEEDKK